jgi:hypothetical protein
MPVLTGFPCSAQHPEQAFKILIEIITQDLHKKKKFKLGFARNLCSPNTLPSLSCSWHCTLLRYHHPHPPILDVKQIRIVNLLFY